MTKYKLKVTSAAEWRRFREEGEIVPLSSGRVVRLRPVALDKLILSGELPDILTPIAAHTLWGNQADNDKVLTEQVDMAKSYFELVNRIVAMVLMEPVVVTADPQDDQVLIDDISLQERVEIFTLAQQPAEGLRAFREQQEKRLELVSDGQDDLQPTEQPGLHY